MAARDTQIILGHANVSTTQQIYTYVDEAAPARGADQAQPASRRRGMTPYCGQLLMVKNRFQDPAEGVVPGGAKGT